MSDDLALPDVLAQVADACGRPAALTLAGAFGGREIYIPRPDAIGEDHPLAMALGVATARKVAHVLGRGDLIIPLGPATSVGKRRAAYRRLREQSKSHSDIARALGVHLRTIERYASLAGEPSQPTLFD